MDASVAPTASPAEPDDPPFVTLLQPDQRAVMRLIEPQGATFRELQRALGWGPERVQAAVRRLVQSRALVCEDGRFRRWRETRPLVAVAPELPRVRSASPGRLQDAMQRAHERYEKVLHLRAEGAQWLEISEAFGLTPVGAKRLMDRARAWDKSGRPATPAQRKPYAKRQPK